MQQNIPNTSSLLYTDTDLERRVNTGTLRKHNELKEYAYSNGNYLLQDTQFQLFDTTFETDQTLTTNMKDLLLTIRQNYDAIHRLERLREINRRKTRQAYDSLITPHLLTRICQRRHNKNQETFPNRQDTPPRMEIIPPPSSSTTYQPTASTSTTSYNPRTSQHPKCYKCHKPYHHKRFCPNYRCLSCRRTQPGHLTRDCPNRVSTPDPRDQFDHDYDYDPDNNLNGEQ